MSDIHTWNHRWFGLWKEYGRGYERCPSIHDFIDAEISAGYNKRRLVHYLKTSVPIAATSRMSFPCAITGTVFDGSLCARTDGVWWWLDDLAHYVEKHDVCLPVKMLENIIKNNHRPRMVSVKQMNELDRSGLGE